MSVLASSIPLATVLVAEQPDWVPLGGLLPCGGDLLALLRRPDEAHIDFAERVAVRLVQPTVTRRRIDHAVLVCDDASSDPVVAARSIVAALLVTALGRGGGGVLIVTGSSRAWTLEEIARRAGGAQADADARVSIVVRAPSARPMRDLVS